MQALQHTPVAMAAHAQRLHQQAMSGPLTCCFVPLRPCGANTAQQALGFPLPPIACCQVLQGLLVQAAHVAVVCSTGPAWQPEVRRAARAARLLVPLPHLTVQLAVLLQQGLQEGLV